MLTNEQYMGAVDNLCDCDEVCKPSLHALLSGDNSPSIKNLISGNLKRHLYSCARELNRVEYLQNKELEYLKRRS